MGAARPTLTDRSGTGDPDKGTGTGEPAAEVGLDLAQPFGRDYLLLSAGYTFLQDPPEQDLDDIRRLGLGRSWGFGRWRSLYLFLENRTNPVPGRGDRLDLTLGATFRTGVNRRTRISLALLVGMTPAAEDYGLSFTAGGDF